MKNPPPTPLYPIKPSPKPHKNKKGSDKVEKDLFEYRIEEAVKLVKELIMRENEPIRCGRDEEGLEFVKRYWES